MLLISLFSFLFSFPFRMYREPKGCVERWRQLAEHAAERRRKGCDHIDQKKKRQVLNPRMIFHAHQARVGRDKSVFVQATKARAKGTATCMYHTKDRLSHVGKPHETHLDPLASQLTQQSQSQLGPISASTMISCVACYSSRCGR